MHCFLMLWIINRSKNKSGIVERVYLGMFVVLMQPLIHVSVNNSRSTSRTFRVRVSLEPLLNSQQFRVLICLLRWCFWLSARYFLFWMLQAHSGILLLRRQDNWPMPSVTLKYASIHIRWGAGKRNLVYFVGRMFVRCEMGFCHGLVAMELSISWAVPDLRPDLGCQVLQHDIIVIVVKFRSLNHCGRLSSWILAISSWFSWQQRSAEQHEALKLLVTNSFLNH